MKVLVFVVGLALTVTPALAQQVISPNEATGNVGHNVTVEGMVSEVHHAASGKVTFVDMGGRYPNNTFTGVIFADDLPKFPSVDALDNKMIDMTGIIKTYQGKPEIILNDATQLKVK